MARQPLALVVAVLLVAGVVCGSNTTTPPETTHPTTIPSTTTIKTTTTSITTTPTTATTTTAPTTTTTIPTTTTTTTAPTTTTTATTTATSPTTTTTTHITNTTTTATTTEEHNTTTASSSTTVETTTTITATTPGPEQVYYYNVTDDTTKNMTYCIIFEGSFNYNITYEATSKEGKMSNKTASITSPQHPQEGAKITGSCGKTQFLAFDWASGKHNITMDFSKSKDGKTWSLDVVTANIFIDPKTFPDAVDTNKTLTITTYFELNPSDIPVNTSYSCISSFKSDNVTGSIDRETPHDLEITAALNQDFQLEAYNLIEKGNFTTATNCAVKVNSIIPIVVGCCLGGLVVIVLIAYIVSNRRRSAGYESTA